MTDVEHHQDATAGGSGTPHRHPAGQGCRDHHHGHQHHHRAGGNLKFAFLLNLAFTILEIGGGFWTNSVAILSDALHDAGDCFSLGLAWYLQRLSAKRPDATFTYGYRRFSTLGALITGVVLIAGLVVIVKNAVERLQDPAEVHAPGMFAMAIVGILFNGYAAWKLHGGESLSEKVVSWHLVEDTLGWGAVLVGSAVMIAWDAPIIDPILSLMISLFVLYNVFRNMKRVALVFMQSVPPGFDVEGFDREMFRIPGVVGSHHTHTWTNDGESHVFSTHLVMASASSREEIIAAKRKVHELLREQKFAHVTVEVELEGETCAAQPDHPPHEISA
ncbi:MAG: cation diffusion facilitator family transporter [Planctomycetaceae bacterium]